MTWVEDWQKIVSTPLPFLVQFFKVLPSLPRSPLGLRPYVNHLARLRLVVRGGDLRGIIPPFSTLLEIFGVRFLAICET